MLLVLHLLFDSFHIAHISSLGGPTFDLCSAWRYGEFWRFGDHQQNGLVYSDATDKFMNTFDWVCVWGAWQWRHLHSEGRNSQTYIFLCKMVLHIEMRQLDCDVTMVLLATSCICSMGIYSNCKMHLLLGYSFKRLEITQGCFVEYREYSLCFFWRSNHFFNFWRFFWKFWNNGIIYSDCKMHLLLWYSFNRFEIIQRSFVGYREYGLCFFLTDGIFLNFWRIFEFWNIGIIYCNCKTYLLLQFSFNRFEFIQGSSIGYTHYGLCFFNPADYVSSGFSHHSVSVVRLSSRPSVRPSV